MYKPSFLVFYNLFFTSKYWNFKYNLLLQNIEGNFSTQSFWLLWNGISPWYFVAKGRFYLEITDFLYFLVTHEIAGSNDLFLWLKSMVIINHYTINKIKKIIRLVDSASPVQSSRIIRLSKIGVEEGAKKRAGMLKSGESP